MRVGLKSLLMMGFVGVLSTGLTQSTVTPVIKCQIQTSVVEASGLEQLSDGSFITHNDGGKPPELYILDSNCQILRTIYIDSANHVDIEDIAVDDSGNVYVGDFGNNNTWHGRTDLQIFKISDPLLLTTDTVVPKKIHFSYSDQTNFAPALADMIYDCEGMFHYNDSLYLFSKSESWATSTYTRLYVLSDIEGTHVAQLKDSLNTGGQINAADLSPDKSTIILTADSYFWKLYGFTHGNWFDGNALKYSLSPVRKYEGVVIPANNQAFLVNDSQESGPTYLMNIDPTILGVKDMLQLDFTVYPNPTTGPLNIELSQPARDVVVSVYNPTGVLIQSFEFAGDHIPLNLEGSGGIYFVKLQSATFNSTRMVVKTME